jgi:hypothetical protein
LGVYQRSVWRWLRLTPSLKSFIITISAVKPVPTRLSNWAKELAGWAVGRKVGATQTCQDIPEKGTIELVMTDGKVTGWTASGQCVVTMGTGDFASMAGKTWYWNAKPTGPMTSEINSTIK